MGRDAHDAGRYRGSSGLHAVAQRQGAGAELDRCLQTRRTHTAALYQFVGHDLLRRPHSGPGDAGGQCGWQQCAAGEGGRVSHRRGGNLRCHCPSQGGQSLHDLRRLNGAVGIWPGNLGAAPRPGDRGPRA